ncbi:uncharacterized protein LOC129737514 [Falco cherrug]|uniref:uncharacterized protein LOC129737514 n=1 Tax=Falco cherrug TaxID=345164 RepID=UPI00247AD4EB|nr:uncharacterized protein LOC129737514 [Falco cherrug]
MRLLESQAVNSLAAFHGPAPARAVVRGPPGCRRDGSGLAAGPPRAATFGPGPQPPGRSRKLGEMLRRLVNSPRCRSVRWGASGRGLVINRPRCECELLGAGPAVAAQPGGRGAAAAAGFFKTTNFSSFMRQLSLYGFRKPPLLPRPPRPPRPPEAPDERQQGEDGSGPGCDQPPTQPLPALAWHATGRATAASALDAQQCQQAWTADWRTVSSTLRSRCFPSLLLHGNLVPSPQHFTSTKIRSDSSPFHLDPAGTTWVAARARGFPSFSR